MQVFGLIELTRASRQTIWNRLLKPKTKTALVVTQRLKDSNNTETDVIEFLFHLKSSALSSSFDFRLCGWAEEENTYSNLANYRDDMCKNINSNKKSTAES